jgi:hypothetical protein
MQLPRVRGPRYTAPAVFSWRQSRKSRIANPDRPGEAQVKITRAVSMSCLAGLAGGLLARVPEARADECALAYAASIAQAKVPHAVTHVTERPGKPPERFEMIFTADKAYMQTNGAWQSMPFSAQSQIDTATASQKRAESQPHSCAKLGSEPINGEAASLLTMHAEVGGKVTDGRMWLSDRTGLPLKSEIHLSDGMVVTDEFRYDAIVAPPGVK